MLLLLFQEPGAPPPSAVASKRYLAAVAGVVGPPLTVGLFVNTAGFDVTDKAAIAWSVWIEPEGFLLEFPSHHFSSRFGIVQHYTSSAEFVSAGD